MTCFKFIAKATLDENYYITATFKISYLQKILSEINT